MYTYGNILVVVLSGYPVYEKLTARQGGDDDERISEVVVIFELICVTIKHSGNTYIFIYLFFFITHNLFCWIIKTILIQWQHSSPLIRYDGNKSSAYRSTRVVPTYHARNISIIFRNIISLVASDFTANGFFKLAPFIILRLSGLSKLPFIYFYLYILIVLSAILLDFTFEI